MSRALDNLREAMAEVCESQIAPWFKDKNNTRITIIVRTIGDNEKDVLVTNDSLSGITGVLQRSGKREAKQ